MKKGFIFNEDLCVNCKACSVACILENGWSTRPREIFTFNSEALSYIPVIHLSIACNHCEKAVCLEGCPSGAYSRDAASGAVIMAINKCIGCNYCKWNCPYDAPKSSVHKGIIEKCDLCFSRLNEGLDPACTAACPTGALGYDTLSGYNHGNNPEWFPEKGLEPSLIFSAGGKRGPLKIVPETNDSYETPEVNSRPGSFKPEWSLILFTFFTTVSVGLVCSSLLKGIFGNWPVIALMLLTAAFSSIFHLGRKLSAWRAVMNITSSPLSREIVMFLVFTIISLISFLVESPGLLIASVLTGLILLLVMDSVYLFSGSSTRIKLHPGQTFLSGLVLASFLSGFVVPFLFLAFIKIAMAILNIIPEKRSSSIFALKFFRIALLVIASAGFATGFYSSYIVIYIMVFSGELADRIFFYHDFDPLNIKSQINKYLNITKNENKTG